MTGEVLDSMDFHPLGELLCPEPEKRPDPWSWSTCGRKDGALEIGGVALNEVAQEFATPLFVPDRVNLRRRANIWATAMAEESRDGYGMNGGDVFYAGRALPCSGVARTVGKVGVRIDTVSLGEPTMAVRSGVEPPGISLHRNNKLDSEAELVLRARDGKGIERVFVDSLPEIAQIEAIAARLNTSAHVIIHVKTGVHTGGNGYISTEHEGQRFGVGAFGGQLEEVAAVTEAMPYLEFRGLHSHIGSQVRGTAAFEEAASIICPLGKKISEIIGRPVEGIDLGGGAGVTYTSDDEPPTPPVGVVHQVA